jgi:YVTN family beta-propeller protein
VLARIKDVYVGNIGSPNSGAAFNNVGVIAIGRDKVWVASDGDASLVAIDPTSNVVVNRISALPGGIGGLVGGLAGIAVGNGVVWATSTFENQVVRIDSFLQARAATVPVGKQPIGIAVGEGSVWVANRSDGTVSRIDPNTNKVVATIKIGHSPGSVAVGYGRVWVAVRA